MWKRTESHEEDMFFINDIAIEYIMCIRVYVYKYVFCGLSVAFYLWFDYG